MAWTFSEKLDAKLAKAGGTLKHVKPPTGVNFSIKVQFDSKVEKAAMADPLLRQEFDDAALDTIDRFVEFVGLKMKATDALAEKAQQAGKADAVEPLKAKMNQDIEQMRGSAQQFGVMQVQKVWTELGRTKAEYKKYKIKIGVTIGSAVAGLAVSIALMASAPFTGGASAALTIVGMVKSGVVIAKETAAAAMEFETAARSLQGQIKLVAAAWAKSKAGAHGMEIGASVVNQFLGSPPPSIKGCQEWMYRCEQKFNGIVLNAHKLAKKIEEMKSGMSKLEADFMAEAKKRLEKGGPKASAQIAQVRKQLHVAIDAAEEKILATQKKLLEQVQRIAEAKKQVAEMKKQVTLLTSYRGTAYRVLDNLLLLSDVAVSGLSGNNLVQSFNDMASTFGSAVAALSIDRIAKVALERTALE